MGTRVRTRVQPMYAYTGSGGVGNDSLKGWQQMARMVSWVERLRNYYRELRQHDGIAQGIGEAMGIGADE